MYGNVERSLKCGAWATEYDSNDRGAEEQGEKRTMIYECVSDMLLCASVFLWVYVAFIFLVGSHAKSHTHSQTLGLELSQAEKVQKFAVCCIRVVHNCTFCTICPTFFWTAVVSHVHLRGGGWTGGEWGWGWVAVRF